MAKHSKEKKQKSARRTKKKNILVDMFIYAILLALLIWGGFSLRDNYYTGHLDWQTAYSGALEDTIHASGLVVRQEAVLKAPAAGILRKAAEHGSRVTAGAVIAYIDAADGKSYNTNHYNLSAIIAVGNKVDSPRAVQFRKWANRIVGDYTIRGYVMDKERFKYGSPLSNEYFELLLEDIREIRLSERKFYQKVTDLYATAVDYDRTALRTRRFFATVQNKMHRAVNGLSAAQIIFSRADAEKEHMGLTTWERAPLGKIRKSDVVIAKNYLKTEELEMLERLVNAYLEFAESRAKLHIPMTMEDWEKRLDKFVSIWDGPITLEQVENVTAVIAQARAESEFEKYRVLQDRLFMSDYDRYLIELEEEVKKEKGATDDSK